MARYMISMVLAAFMLLGFTNTSFAASLGVMVEEVSKADAEKLDLESGLGLKVTAVKEGSPAEKAGIEEGMVIITMAGKDIKSEDDLMKVLEKTGSKLKITVITKDGWEEEKIVRFKTEKVAKVEKKPTIKRRPEPEEKPEKTELDDEELAEIEKDLVQLRKDLNRLIRRLKSQKKGQEKSVKPTRSTARKEPRPSATEKPEKPKKPDSSKPKAGSPFLGAVLESAPEGDKGVEILRVIESYPAAKAGLKQYDIILKINGTSVNKVEQVRDFITKAGVGGILKMEIDRYGKIVKIDVKIGARPAETQ